MTDQQIVDKVRAGDEAAFQTLHQCLRDPLFRFADGPPPGAFRGFLKTDLLAH
jgi:hypothetical protein